MLVRVYKGQSITGRAVCKSSFMQVKSTTLVINMDLYPLLLSATFTMLVLLTLVIRSSLILLLVKILAATGAPPTFNRANPLQERAVRTNGRVELNATANLVYPVQETEPPLLQEDVVLQAVEEAIDVRLAVRVAQESLHQRSLPSALVTGQTGVNTCNICFDHTCHKSCNLICSC